MLRSLSPAIHNRAFAALGLDAVYVPLQAESLAPFMQALPDLALSGFSVTRPYKQEILRRARGGGGGGGARRASVNTVVVRDGRRLVGSSTDGDGVLLPLERRIDVKRASAWSCSARAARRAPPPWP